MAVAGTVVKMIAQVNGQELGLGVTLKGEEAADRKLLDMLAHSVYLAVLAYDAKEASK